jgi:hypothetical protein
MKQELWKMTVLAIGALMASSTLTQAQQNCAARDTVIQRLASAYGETRRSIGLAQNNTMVEVFASSTTGTWTITVTNTAGRTCLVASGQAFEQLAEALPTPAEDV